MRGRRRHPDDAPKAPTPPPPPARGPWIRETAPPRDEDRPAGLPPAHSLSHISRTRAEGDSMETLMFVARDTPNSRWQLRTTLRGGGGAAIDRAVALLAQDAESAAGPKAVVGQRILLVTLAGDTLRSTAREFEVAYEGVKLVPTSDGP